MTRYGVARVADQGGERMTPDTWSLRNFRPEDLVAPTEGGAWVNAAAARGLDSLADDFGAATGLKIKINEERDPGGSTAGRRRGTADPKDNPHVGKSQHLHGKAFDIQVQSWTPEQRAQFVTMARAKGFKGFGFYGETGHLHIDMGSERTWGKMPDWAQTAMATPIGAAAGPTGNTPPLAPQAGGIPRSPVTIDVRPTALAQAKIAAENTLDPQVRSRMEQLISAAQATETAQIKAQDDGYKTQAFQSVIESGKVDSIDPELLRRLDPATVNSLYSLEGNMAKGGAANDPAAWQQVMTMSDKELIDANLYEAYANKLDRTYLDRALTMQRDARRAAEGDAEGTAARAGMRTRGQVVEDTVKGLGLKDDIKGNLNIRLDQRIAAYNAQAGKAPDAIVLQDMVDKLLLEGRGTTLGFGGQGRALDAKAPEKFLAAGDWAEVQPDDQAKVVNRYMAINPGKVPDPEKALDIYNRAMRFYLGAAADSEAVVDEDEYNEHVRAMTKELGISPSKELRDQSYGRFLLRYLNGN